MSRLPPLASAFGRYLIAPGIPNVAEHFALRTAAGLSPPPQQCDVASGLAASVHCLLARLPPPGSALAQPAGNASPKTTAPDSATQTHPPSGSNAANAAGNETLSAGPSGFDHTQGELVGMVRLVGDGAMMIEVCDMAVHPAHQGHGLGKKLLDEMLKWVDDHCPYAYLSLLALDAGRELYRSRGFTETKGVGMRRAKWARGIEVVGTKPVP